MIRLALNAMHLFLSRLKWGRASLEFYALSVCRESLTSMNRVFFTHRFPNVTWDIVRSVILCNMQKVRMQEERLEMMRRKKRERDSGAEKSLLWNFSRRGKTIMREDSQGSCNMLSNFTSDVLSITRMCSVFIPCKVIWRGNIAVKREEVDLHDIKS